MGPRLIDVTNRLFIKATAKIPGQQLYKKSAVQVHVAKKKRNSSLQEACQVFAQEFADKGSSGDFVNDLKVVKQDGVHITVEKVDGSRYKTLNLATNSYNDLDLEFGPRGRMVDYVLTDSLSSCLSRKIAGKLPIHEALEREVCGFLGLPASVLATSGYIAQQATLFALFHRGDVVFSDEHNHSSLVDGMRLCGAKVFVYRHLDYGHLEELIRKHRHAYNAAGIVSDGVFSAHGTMADLDKITALKEAHNLLSVIDDTHGFATIGGGMRGILDFFDTRPDVLTASLAKGLAGFGGVIAGGDSAIRVIDCFGRQNINTSHLSPLVAAQSFFNLQFLRQNLAAIRDELTAKVHHFNQELEEAGLKHYQDHGRFSHPIFSFCGDSEAQVIKAYQGLLEAGFTAAFFPPPVSPLPTIRFSLHRKVDFRSLSRLARLLKASGLQPLAEQYWVKMDAIRLRHRPATVTAELSVPWGLMS
jgi:8-amino-7-oxononanoate synthase